MKTLTAQTATRAPKPQAVSRAEAKGSKAASRRTDDTPAETLEASTNDDAAKARFEVLFYDLYLQSLTGGRSFLNPNDSPRDAGVKP